MERLSEDRNLEVFNSFVSKTKEAFSILSDNIKSNIKKYEQAIDATEREVSDSVSSRGKCEREIAKMESEIGTIKEAIDNVENTYKKMVDAYSSTSKGETKDIYIDIIDAAKRNCEKEVERHRSEIARLNSDIEAIKNNIAEFTRVIDGLNRALDEYKKELAKYKEASEYLEDTSTRIGTDFEDIAEGKKRSKIGSSRMDFMDKSIGRPRRDFDFDLSSTTTAKSVVDDKPKKEEPRKVDRIDDFKMVEEVQKEKAPAIEEPKEPEKKVDDSLQRIYDLTGYKPQKEEKKEEERPISDSAIFSANLDNLFADITTDESDEESGAALSSVDVSYDDDNMSEWEKILNGKDDTLELKNGTNISVPVMDKSAPSSEPQKSSKNLDSDIDTADQLLKPYGTSYERLSKLAGDKIVYKDGRVITVDMSAEDVVKAVNSIDGIDLRAMKTVGPEVTLLRKIKQMKEGRA